MRKLVWGLDFEPRNEFCAARLAIKTLDEFYIKSDLIYKGHVAKGILCDIYPKPYHDYDFLKR